VRAQRKRDDGGRKTYNVKRSEPVVVVPLERGRFRSGLLPRVPLARRIYVFILRGLTGHKKKIHNTYGEKR